ncbi:pentatricopeptide repeat-containing protein At2g27800, mitochondrial-like [Impatiens glandulifera]|uniref:pentatricopeptide repeat-containing protein At2g27800, mitochondrial-like n=1 Tax=Impatiens glandulifera TaxID=253017 RepID=UPI001FB11DC3|nr:pentatricopeptide repeat-containing protein At2g27800, mitochondrial-like [Impatiens glandulifera]XP_047317588.1 pentatricopeptide repeat-containing protein At2g27800, mitochondrial-like [Impatiens glandulifera]XP_047317589.1 pentatricopeptide repeat-containing protein At2g27800, mitochondrial-like [Impatiens glandulifera]
MLSLNRHRFLCLNSRIIQFFPSIPYPVCDSLSVNAIPFCHSVIINPRILKHMPRCPFMFNLSYHSSTKYIPRTLRKRINKRLREDAKPVLDEALFEQAKAQIPPRFTAEELTQIITLQEDPLVCLELFKWASKQPRFIHDSSVYHITIKKIGAAKMYEEMDEVIDKALTVPEVGNEALYNTMIYFSTEARKLSKAVNVYKHMRDNRKVDCKPSIRTYNLLFSAFLSRRHNSYINHIYMETIRSLFKQMVDDGVEPDIYTLNSMIKGYVLSLHLNDALRIFHQMGVVYKCLPNSFSYDYLIHGLCAQGRTDNARKLWNEMKTKGYVPSSISYNSFVNSLALCGEVEESVSILKEMTVNSIPVDFITYQTVLEEICQHRNVVDAIELLKKLKDNGLVIGDAYRKLHHQLQDYSRSSSKRY